MFESLPAAAFVGAVGLGLVHGVEPGHGWPVAATYALEQSNKWLSGLAASVLIGVGHLVSSLAVVGAFFLLKSSVGLESVWWIDYVAGGLLILLGVHEYRSGHGHDHSNDGHGHDHSHDDGNLSAAADQGLWSIAGTAFVLGFAHEEEFEIIALCAGSSLCLELMTAYALAVVVGIVALTLLLVAGYEHYEDRVERLAVHFPTISAVVLVAMGLGFVVGVL